MRQSEPDDVSKPSSLGLLTPRLVLVTASLTVLTPSVTGTYLAGFPRLAQYLEKDLGSIWPGLSGFLLGLILCQLFYGLLIDRFGRKLPILIALALFVATSLLIAVAPVMDIVSGLHFFQATGGAAVMVVSRAMIFDIFPERDAARVLSMILLGQGLAPMVAAVFGNHLLSLGSWGAAFLLLLSFGLVCLATVQWALPETLPRDRRPCWNYRHFLTTWGCLLSTRDFIIPTLTGSLTLACVFILFGNGLLDYLKLRGVEEDHFAWLFAINAIGLAVAAYVNQSLVRYIDLRTIVSAAVFSFTLVAGLLFVCSTTSSLLLLTALLFLIVAYIPLISANAIALAMAASGENRGSGSAIIGVLQVLIASLVSTAFNLVHDGTAVPMAVTVLVCGCAASLVWFFGQWTRQ